ncbi:unnamed protein product [Closterium sp. Yama58-4]|nr:unnamed protein product [Closterium sp. Yama58-4]
MALVTEWGVLRARLELSQHVSDDTLLCLHQPCVCLLCVPLRPPLPLTGLTAPSSCAPHPPQSYFSWLLRDNLTDTLEGQVWLPQDPALLLQPPTALQPEGPVALIPRNGDSREGFFGEADALFRKDTDYLNAGVMLCRRSPASFEFFQRWYNVPKDDYHLFNHVWEQERMNQVARWPHWRRRVLIVPHQELTGPPGAMVRHMWDRVVYEALEEALGNLQSGL